MPTDERLWTDDRDHLQDRREPSIQLDEEQAIIVREPDPPMHSPAQHNNLMSERSIFSFKSVSLVLSPVMKRGSVLWWPVSDDPAESHDVCASVLRCSP